MRTMKMEYKVKIDTSELDVALEKAKQLQEIVSRDNEKSNGFMVQVFRKDDHWIAIMSVEVFTACAAVGCGYTPKEALKELLGNME